MMKKKLMLAYATLFVCFGAQAQITQGKILASGSVGLEFSKYREVFDGNTEAESNMTSLWLIPRAGYFVTDALAVGAGISLSTQSSKFDDDDKFTSSSISIVPFARYYLPQGFYGQVELGAGLETEKWTQAGGGDDDEDKFNSFLWSIGVGYAHFLNDNVSVEPMVTYMVTTYTENDTDIKDKFGDLAFQIAFSIYLP